MTTARAVIASAALIAVAIAGSAWWTHKATTTTVERYQLVNVGGGQTHRLDKQTGAVLQCYQDACTDITSAKASIPPPPPGATVDEVPAPPEGSELDQ